MPKFEKDSMHLIGLKIEKARKEIRILRIIGKTTVVMSMMGILGGCYAAGAGMRVGVLAACFVGSLVMFSITIICGMRIESDQKKESYYAMKLYRMAKNAEEQ